MAATIDPYKYFAYPKSPGQKQYEALRAFYIDKLPAKLVADRFGYTLAIIQRPASQIQDTQAYLHVHRKAWTPRLQGSR